MMGSIYDKMKDLVSVAARSGMLHAIDSTEERIEAEKILQEIKAEEVPHELVFLVDGALKNLHGTKQGQPIQVNPLFGEKACFTKDFTPNKEFSLLTPLPDGAYASFLVYYLSPDAKTHQEQVFVTKDEWGQMIVPLTATGSDGQKTVMTATQEVKTIGRSVAAFENVVGPRAGTVNDLGSWNGNAYIWNKLRTDKDRQQDCVNDALTAAQFLHLISAHALIQYHSFDPADPLAQIPDVHVATQLKRKDGDPLIIDTWINSNGQEPLTTYDKVEWISITKPKESK